MSTSKIESLIERMEAKLAPDAELARLAWGGCRLDPDDLRALVSLGRVAVAFRETYEKRLMLDGRDQSADADMTEIERVLGRNVSAHAEEDHTEGCTERCSGLGRVAP